jgi:hypothetical protein
MRPAIVAPDLIALAPCDASDRIVRRLDIAPAWRLTQLFVTSVAAAPAKTRFAVAIHLFLNGPRA